MSRPEGWGEVNKPFYRADGTLLVEDLQADHAAVNARQDR
jgi:hypothetical protein